MSTKVLLSLCLAACVAGCASPRPATRDAASAMQEFEENFKLMILMAAAAGADHEVTELGPQLALTSEQETAFREAYRQEFEQAAGQIRANLASLSNSVANGKPAPSGEAAPFRIRSPRELWKSILTPEQLAAYDAIKERQRKELAAEFATRRLNRIDSRLGLTEDQRNRVLEIFMMSEERGQQGLAKDHLWPSPDTDMENKSLAAVLTPEQFKKYQKLAASPDSRKQQWYAGGFFVPPTFSLPHFGGSFRVR